MASGLERAQPFDVMYGYDYNRVVDALNNQRTASVGLAAVMALTSGYQAVDSTSRARFRFLVPVNLTSISKVTISFTLDRYGHLLPDDDSEAAEAVAAMIDKAAGQS